MFFVNRQLHHPPTKSDPKIAVKTTKESRSELIQTQAAHLGNRPMKTRSKEFGARRSTKRKGSGARRSPKGKAFCQNRIISACSLKSVERQIRVDLKRTLLIHGMTYGNMFIQRQHCVKQKYSWIPLRNGISDNEGADFWDTESMCLYKAMIKYHEENWKEG